MKGFSTKSIAEIGKMGLAAMNKNLPAILTGAAIAGLVATMWTTYKSAPDIKSAVNCAKMDKAEKESADSNGEAVESTPEPDDVKLNAWETFTAVAPYAWKPVVCGAFTISCIIGAHVLNIQRLGVLSLAYKVSETKLKEYETKAREILGDDKAKDLHDAVVKETTAQMPLTEKFIVRTGKGKQLFLDSVSGQYFYSSKEEILRAESYINQRVARSDCMTLNDFYSQLGLDEIGIGDSFVWGMNQSEPLKIKFTVDERILNEERQVVYILDYNVTVDPDNFR